ncbi:sperm-tail PG-rich repeat-containing protein 2-like [Cebidichthys violaceus]|uniref:sperm-tail PG-rich repeat-containing protein 2-like n=1 Tax=Cebidichthys violaceus TaxID=271503 RepID=UPI0035CB1A74
MHEQDTPPPNSYNVSQTFEKANGRSYLEPRNEAAERRQSCFLSAALRDHFFLQCDPTVPGPGQYNPSVKSFPQMALISSREDRFKVSADTNPGPGAGYSNAVKVLLS